MAFFAVALLTVHVPLLLWVPAVGRAECLLIAVTLALLAMILEAIAWRGLDNLFVPLGSFVLLKAFIPMPAPALAQCAAVAAAYDSRHTDDYPTVEVVVTFRDGATRALRSQRQHAAMLPWTTEAGQSWDPGIALAIAAVLPADSPDIERLRLGDREELLAYAVMEHIDPEAWFEACE